MELSILCLYNLHRVCGKRQDCNALSTGVCLIKLLNIACVWVNCEVTKRDCITTVLRGPLTCIKVMVFVFFLRIMFVNCRNDKLDSLWILGSD